MPKLKNIEKVAQGLGTEVGWVDGKPHYIALEDKNFTLCIQFDDKGDKVSEIFFSKKIYQVVDEQVLGKLEPK